ncbi:MAG TPA: hypothetical protein DEG17_11230 [Cyanobacteria bacterium UBA11149]|nr:hypothetical protein [Cyanobacteria bacterium UBA11366]HBK63694.1 hypothetical protein [Cyanobacteria bacterium UBA11166]HBR75753.1 hypothetical protein [Cyanobacteria bacterium UBA11159]HBS70940.1 hypothetical protein [Cyanobacteria bacterium UBA11153]HBW89421.1 hypothetical protein [Cyanobacteria bacterium UBA11149]HCA98104.1 hypothetical protein [Cyanobacteria bacterium UBA9226]
MTTTMNIIDELIKTHNPFAGHNVVRPAQIWGKSFPDAPSINSHASNAIFDAVAKVRQGQRQTVGITITAEKGLGKSHLISRIRHRLQAEDGALFIYMNKYDNLNKIKYQFLEIIASSLRAYGSYHGVMQWQEIAAALINDARDKNYTPQEYVHGFPSWLSRSPNTIENLTNSIIQVKPNINNPYIVKAILWTLSPTHATYATHWLSGWELTQNQAEAMELPNPKREEREAEALTTVRQILDITSQYKVPVICFDELDIADADDNGFTAAQVVASLAKDLYNSLERAVFLLAMYPETWSYQVKSLPQAEAVVDRLVSEQPNRKPISLNYLNSDDVVALVYQWLKNFYSEHQQIPPLPLYPFTENQLREFGKQKPTVRDVLKWCAANFLPVDVKDKTHPVKSYFDAELENLQGDVDILAEDNNEQIAKALRLSFETLAKDKQTLEGITVEGVEDIEASNADKGYIHFRIVGTENQKTVKIGVAVLQQSGGKYQGAALKRLIDYKKFGITRGCLVRSKQINSGAGNAKNFAKQLLKNLGGEWVKLQEQEIKPLIAIRFVYDNCESYELSEEEILDFIKENKLASNNPLIREILSDPSGQEPDNLTDDDLPMRMPMSVDDSDNGLEFT